MTDELLLTDEKLTDINIELRAKADTASPAELFERLQNRLTSVNPSVDLIPLEKAYALAFAAHMGQKRKSGAPYIIHPLNVALILADLNMDMDSILAGLLHDVVEDTDTELADIERAFGADVAMLVDGVTKLTRLSWAGGKIEQQAENLRKMFIAMAKDIRVVIIKLADRTHNMRTLQYMTPEKQQEKARETMDIYAPLADRLGISRLKIELDNLALSVLEPEAYKKLVADVDRRKAAKEDYIGSIVNEVSVHIEKAGIRGEVYGRVKHYFSIYRKMNLQHCTLDEIYDLFAVRVLVRTVQDCYAVLGIIHEMYIPIPGRFKDYIAMPKANRYQSLHTTVIGRDGQPFEIQIRTFEMHHTAEYGVAAHWKYKEGKKEGLTAEEEKMTWLRQILEWQDEVKDDSEFLNSLKSDLSLFSEDVYVFSPQGDVKVLPKGSTPIDFAYAIHSAVGNRMVGARVNDKHVTIDYVLHSGDRVEIITSQNSRGPSRDWLKLVKSSQARNKINQWFRSQNKEENIQKGRELLEKYCKAKGLDMAEIVRPEFQEKVIKRYGFNDWDQVVAAVGHGGLKEGQVIGRLVDLQRFAAKRAVNDDDVLKAVAENKTEKETRKATGGVIIEGMADMAVHFSKCCNPIPGDEIVGFVTRGRGVSIHRTDCVNIMNLPEIERGRLIEAEWDLPEGENKERYITAITMYARDRIGLLADIARIMTEEEKDIVSLRTDSSKQGTATIVVYFETAGVAEINHLMAKFRQVGGVIDVRRSSG